MGSVTELQQDAWRFEQTAWEAGCRSVAGIDEAGRGPLAGPVVAAAVILPRDFDITGIKDSKALSAVQRERACQRILADAEAVGVGIVEPAVIDRINILQATYEAMRAALHNMGAAFDFVLIDGNCIIPKLTADQRAIVEGDSKCASIAAASIVAKVTRDGIMVELAAKYPCYGFEKHKGYGTVAHLRAIREHGVCEIHRKSFSPIARKAEKNCPQQGLF